MFNETLSQANQFLAAPAPEPSYETVAFATAIFPGKDTGQILYPLLGLIDEIGEVIEVVLKANVHQRTYVEIYLTTFLQLSKVAGLLKKGYRDSQGLMTAEKREDLGQYLGSTATFLSQLARGAHAIDIARLPDYTITDETRVALSFELGDAHWYLGVTTLMCGLTTHVVQKTNIRKLKDRAERGVLQGSGDHR